MTRVAVVGLGAISFEHLTKLEGIAGAHVVGVCDLEPTLTAAVAERFGVAGAFTDYATMLERTCPEVVHVLTPPQSHLPLARAALEAGANVVVEKPIAPSYEEFLELRTAAEERKLLLCENYTYRFAPAVLRAIESARAGALGDVVGVDVSYGGVMGSGGAYGDRDVVHFAHALPGGALQNFVSHPLSVALAFVGPVESVAVWRRRLDPAAIGDDELRALLGGRRSWATVTVSANARPSHFTLRVQGTAGGLEVDVLGEVFRRFDDRSPLTAATRRGLTELGAAAAWTGRTLTGRRDPWFAGLRVLLERFYRAVAREGPPPLAMEEMDAVNAAVRDVLVGAHAR